jgi:hypothetical protein
MNRYKKPRNDFYKPELPVRVYHDRRNKCWKLIDHNNTAIADNLTKEIAETLEQAVNVVSEALTCITAFLKYENIVCPTKEADPECIIVRENLIENATQFLIDLNVIEAPLGCGVFDGWKNGLLEDFYKKCDI